VKDKGSVFTIYLPIAAADSAAGEGGIGDAEPLAPAA